MTKSPNDNDVRQVVDILEKILAKNESIISVCNRSKAIAARCSKPEKQLQRTANLVIMHYSNLCALGGGASAIPGIIPGLGLVYSLIGSSAIDAFLALKFELEMSLALAHTAGFDISDPRERKLAFILACAALEDAYDADKNPKLSNVIDIAMNEYSTRELSKTLIKAIARVLVLINAKKLTRFFPVIGMGIEASVNKIMSTRLGNECWKAYKLRKSAETSGSAVVIPESSSPDSKLTVHTDDNSAKPSDDVE